MRGHILFAMGIGAGFFLAMWQYITMISGGN